MKPTGGSSVSLKAMQLASGRFFGTTRLELEQGGMRFSVTDYEAHQVQPWHTHEHPTLFIQVAGEQLDEGRGAQWDLPRLGVTHHPTSSPHRSRVGPAGARGVNLELSEPWLARNGLRPDDLGEHRVQATDRQRWAALRLIILYSPAPVGNPELSDLALELVEGLVARRLGGESEAPRWLRRVEERLREEFRGPLGLGPLAREAGVHPVHLARSFRRRHGCSVIERLQRLRLQAAAEQVLAGDSLVNAALDAGFADQAHFSRTLKAHAGFSPGLLKRVRTAAHRSARS